MIISYYYISKIIIFCKVFEEYLYTDDIILNFPSMILIFYFLDGLYENDKNDKEFIKKFQLN